MSVLIKGMKKPKDCYQCRLHYGHGECGVSVDGNCPLIEIPDHGDLIDKTDLMESLADWQLSESPEEGQNWWLGKNVTSHELQYSIYRLLGDVYEEVRDEPVVIPAERSEDAAN